MAPGGVECSGAVTKVGAVVLAAGESRRLGQDKALAEAGGCTLVDRVVADCMAGAVDDVVVVRRRGAAPLPPSAAMQPVRVVEVPPGEMIDSLVAGLGAAGERHVLVFPVDHALAGAEVVRQVVCVLRRRAAGIVLPVCDERPGHPIGLARDVLPEVLAAAGTGAAATGTAGTRSLRDVVRRDPARVVAVPVSNPWIWRDIDEPEDLRAARARLRALAGRTASEVMFAHRSHRAYRSDPIPDAQLEWLVDAARHASTSSFIQAYSIVAVRDAARRQRVNQLCGLQPHIAEAPVFLAVCADLQRIARCCERMGLPFRADGLEAFVEATVDAALVGQNLLLAAEAEGLGGCMIGAARNHPVALAELLGLPPFVYVVFGMVLGHPADQPIPRGRMPLAAVLHHERYDESRIEPALDAADEQMRAWARRTNAERGGYMGRPVNETKGWRERMAALWGKGGAAKARPHLLGELRRLGFGIAPEAGQEPESRTGGRAS